MIKKIVCRLKNVWYVIKFSRVSSYLGSTLKYFKYFKVIKFIWITCWYYIFNEIFFIICIHSGVMKRWFSGWTPPPKFLSIIEKQLGIFAPRLLAPAPLLSIMFSQQISKPLAFFLYQNLFVVCVMYYFNYWSQEGP
jgi:hypothetical protein